MRPLAAIERFLFEAPAWKVVCATFLVLLVKVGIWPIPNFELSRQVALDPFANPFTIELQHYLWWNWFSPFIAWLIGATGPRAFLLLHLAFAVGFLAVFVRTLFARLPDREARVALVLFASLPIAGEPLYWICFDSLTLLLMAAALALPRRPLACLLIGVGLGLQHFEQASIGAFAVLFAFGVAMLLRAGRPHYPLSWALALFAGTVAGKLLLLGVVSHWQIVVNSGRPYWLKMYLPQMLEQFFLHWQVVLFSALGLGWLIALRYAEAGRAAVPTLLTLFGLLFLLPISADQTRVFAIVSFLLIAVSWLLDPAFLAGIGNRAAAGLAGLGLVLPWAWTWSGSPRTSAFPFDIALVLWKLTGWPKPPEQLLLWPYAVF